MQNPIHMCIIKLIQQRYKTHKSKTSPKALECRCFSAALFHGPVKARSFLYHKQKKEKRTLITQEVYYKSGAKAPTLQSLRRSTEYVNEKNMYYQKLHWALALNNN